MIKKFALILIAIVSLSLSLTARDNYSRDASALPLRAQNSISANFRAKVSLVKIESERGRIDEYEVILTDGTEITFDRDGYWKNVEVNSTKSVPSAYIPSAIAAYVRTKHHKARIIGIEKDRDGYDAELDNGLEIKFDRNGRFLRYDD